MAAAVLYSTDVTSCRKYRNPHNTLLELFGNVRVC
jgi:hypothetical protein